jgi:hypothetical protein
MRVPVKNENITFDIVSTHKSEPSTIIIGFHNIIVNKIGIILLWSKGKCS